MSLQRLAFENPESAARRLNDASRGSLHPAKMGFSDWTGAWPQWSEIVVFVESCRTRPSLLGIRDDLAWLAPAA